LDRCHSHRLIHRRHSYVWDLSHLYTTGEVTLIARSSIPGDFNFDGAVDAADYVVWRKTDGTPAGYNFWRAHFGQFTGGGSDRGVNGTSPEPSTLVLYLMGMAMHCSRRRARVS
jgi:hypothetical protein